MRVTQVISRTMERWPDQLAVVAKNTRWTYAQLGHESSLLQERLREAGLGKGDRVVIWQKNSAHYIAAYLAILEIDGIAVAVHSDSMISDVLQTIQHVGAAGIVTTTNLWEKHREALEQSGLRFALLPDITLSLDREVRTMEAPGGLAQIVYTSGTTGNPKGVMLSHQNLIENTHSILSRLCLSPSDAIVAILPFTFVYGNSVLLTHLFAGAKVVIEDNPLYPHCIVDSMNKEAATGFSGVASNYGFMLREAGFNASHVPSIRYFTSAGGPMPPSLLRKVREAFPSCAFHVMYGQTEATARITMLPPEDLDRKPGSAGRAVPGVSIEILSDTGERVSPGETGEIVVAAANVMQGYWQDSIATEKILDHGFLHTGDIGHLDDEGYLFITGRNSEMIKSSGFRVNPEEIEDVLLEHDCVAEAGVAGVVDDLLGEAIAAAVVLKPGRQASERELLAHCAGYLASYKRPKAVYLMAKLPRSVNGKILRGSLRGQLESLHRQACATK